MRASSGKAYARRLGPLGSPWGAERMRLSSGRVSLGARLVLSEYPLVPRLVLSEYPLVPRLVHRSLSRIRLSPRPLG